MLEAVRVGGWLMVVVRVQEVVMVGAIEECNRGIWYAPHPKGQRVLHHGNQLSWVLGYTTSIRSLVIVHGDWC